MREFLFLVFVELILFPNFIFSNGVYQVSNGELLKGVLLGALIASQKNQINFVPFPYYHNYMFGPSHTNNHNPNNYQTQEVEYKELTGTSSQTDNPNNPNNYNQNNSPNNYQRDNDNNREVEYKDPYNHVSSEEIETITEQSQPLTESTPTMAPITTTTTSTTTTTTMSPLDALHQHLGLPPNAFIVVLLPSSSSRVQELMFEKQPENMTQQNEQSIENVYTENSIRTNAVAVGTKQLDSQGWKPVPKTTTTTNPSIETRDRYLTKNSRPYIEKSQFGQRTRTFKN